MNESFESGVCVKVEKKYRIIVMIEFDRKLVFIKKENDDYLEN